MVLSMLDWLTLRLDHKDCPNWGGWRRLSTWGDRILRYCPATGQVAWDIAAWDSIRSDSHQLAIRVSGLSLQVQGSPARVMGNGDTVFGAEGGSDPFLCAVAMLVFVSRLIHYYPLPSPRVWKLTRVDVTYNYLLGSLGDVRCALSELRNVEGGRYRVSQQAGDTVYWSHLSRLRAGKAYAKGPHLHYLLSKSSYTGCQYSESDLALAQRLLRLELKLGREWFRRQKPWYFLKSVDFDSEHDSYFLRMVGVDTLEVTDVTFVDRLVLVAPTPGKGKAAARTWGLIQTLGWQATRELMPSSTWYDHLKLLKIAGLGDADISSGRVVNLRRPLILRPVSSWEELRNVA